MKVRIGSSFAEHIGQGKEYGIKPAGPIPRLIVETEHGPKMVSVDAELEYLGNCIGFH
jgi:hypothetical protein